jgi:hypothetical protein
MRFLTNESTHSRLVFDPIGFTQNGLYMVVITIEDNNINIINSIPELMQHNNDMKKAFAKFNDITKGN